MSNDEKPAPSDWAHTWRIDSSIWEKIKPLAREKRISPTFEENLLWQQLRRHQIGGFKFRRQHPIDRFIVDFFCAERQLAIEVDGLIHEYTKEEDALRQAFLESLGLTVVRFTNDDVRLNMDDVLRTIREAVGLTK